MFEYLPRLPSEYKKCHESMSVVGRTEIQSQVHRFLNRENLENTCMCLVSSANTNA